MIRWLATVLMKRCERKKSVFYIRGTEADSDAYMIRYIVFKSDWMCLYIHRFLRSDRDVHHDHPWNFLTYIISGSYEEEMLNPKTGVTIKTTRKQGSVARRKFSDAHKVLLRRSWVPHDCKDAPLTICLMGPRRQDWGFWVDNPGYLVPAHKKVPWREFLGITGESVGNE